MGNQLYWRQILSQIHKLEVCAMTSKYRSTKDRSLVTGRHKSTIIIEMQDLKGQENIDGSRLRALEEELATVDDCPDFLCDDADHIGRRPPPPTPPRPHPMVALAFFIYLCRLGIYKLRNA